MIIGIGTPSSQSRIPLPIMCSLCWSGGENTGHSVPHASRLRPAARLAANASNNSAVSQKDSFAAPLRALSAAVFTSAITALRLRDHGRTHTDFHLRASRIEARQVPSFNAGAGKGFREPGKSRYPAHGRQLRRESRNDATAAGAF
jgi:hypothetical protein